jgi:DNA-binding response OmpR family regulator
VIGLIQTQKPDLILLDLMLPNRDGMSILEVMRGEEWKNDTPVIILTNLSGRGGLREEAAALHATYFDKASTDVATIIDEVKRRI